jgi:uncharacterized protein YbjT (DUF2867 family)
MRVAIAGAHGKIAQLLTRQLADRGDTVLGLIRNPAHAAELAQLGATPVVCDLEHATVAEIVLALPGADAAVFAAGAGPGSSAERKLTMDRDGAIKLLRAATQAEVSRFVIVSAVGAEDPPDDDEVFSVYLRAKAEADAAVAASDRDWTIVRPGRLTDEPGSGRVRIELDPFRGSVTREDVATVLTAVLGEPRSAGKRLYVNGGDQLVAAALAAVL